MDNNHFKSSNLFKKYDSWISSLIATDYYSPATFDDEGNLLSEDSFNDDGYQHERERILEVSHYIYREIAHCHVFHSYPAGSIAYGEDDPVSVVLTLLDEQKDCSHVALLGTIYFLLVYDYPNYSAILGNRRIKMRAYNELFTQLFTKISCIQDWLDLYASLRDSISVLDLPPSMQTPKALEYLRNLQKDGILDDNYNLIPPANRDAFRKLIAEKLSMKAGCPYHELEEHFKVKNLRDRRGLDALENRIKDPNRKKNSNEEIIYNTICHCFTKI